jgi:hypothetical protein
VLTEGARIRNAVAHLVGKYDVALSPDEISISGRLGWAKGKQMTTAKLVVLRAIMFTVGRFFSNLVRKFLQRMLITGKSPAPFRFTRTLRWHGDELKVVDELSARSWNDVRAAGIGAAQTSIYVVMSRTYQAGQLQPWLDLTEKMRELPAGEPLRVERTF